MGHFFFQEKLQGLEITAAILFQRLGILRVKRGSSCLFSLKTCSSVSYLLRKEGPSSREKEKTTVNGEGWLWHSPATTAQTYCISYESYLLLHP